MSDEYKYRIGDRVHLDIPYLGYRNAEVVGYDYPRLIIQFSSGLEISVREDEVSEGGY
jgi:hypothetical protein